MAGATRLDSRRNSGTHFSRLECKDFGKGGHPQQAWQAWSADWPAGA